MNSIVSSLGAKILFADFAPPFRACLSVISNPKALSSVWPSFKNPVPFLNYQVCSMPFFRNSPFVRIDSYWKNRRVCTFRMETCAWPALTWGQLNIAIPIKVRFTFWFYKGLCKQNVSLHGGVSHFTALENSIRAVGLKITKTTPGGLATTFDLAAFRLSMIALVENLSIIREL